MTTLSGPNFTAGEYDARLAKTRARMSDMGFDLVLVSDPANINYLTGYNCWSFTQVQVLLVPATGDMLFFLREIDAAGAVLTTHLAETQVLSYPERYVEHPDIHPMDWVAEVMRDHGVAHGTLAIESDSNFFTVRSNEALRRGLPEAHIVDARKIVNWVRAVKSDAEVDKIRTAGRIAHRVMARALEVIEPGVRQCDVAAEIYATGIRGLSDAGGDYTAAPPFLPTGATAGVPHMTFSDAPFVSGEATTLELSGCYQRYHAPLARTIFLGEPPKRLADMADIVDEGANAALATVRPGVRCEDVEAAWREVIGRYGFAKASRIGYSIGIGYPLTTWMERTMSLRPGDTTVLESNMTFHMILGMWMDGWGYELSEPFVVTDSGPECFSNLPRGLTVKK